MTDTALKDLVDSSDHIVVIQADNPDGDSLASSLALEQILSDLGKKISLYCGAEIPSYLRYMSGWDRVVHELPKQFDASIIVDTSALTLLEILQKTGELTWVKAKKCIVLDHHASEPTIDFATAIINESTLSTGELIYNLATLNNWQMSLETQEFIASSILSDSLGLTSEAVSAPSVRVLAELVGAGVSLAKLDNIRRAGQKKSAELLKYKGELLKRIEYDASGRIAIIHIPWPEIERYSHAYNPSMLVIDEMRMVDKVCLAIALKTYPGGRITGKVRANFGYRVASAVAEHFGGGGHVYAAGFKITDGRTYDEIKAECIKEASRLLGELDKEKGE